MKQIILIFIVSFMITSCHQKENVNGLYEMVDDVEEEMIPQTRQSVSIQSAPLDKIEIQEINKKIIKDGRLGLRVTELESTKLRVDTLLKKHNGYYANESYNNTDWESTYNLMIRIPSTNFELFIYEIETGTGEILYKAIDARDITDQFIDLEIRLENKRNYLKRYTDLLNQAKSVKEILEIEEKIRGLEEEIESTTGRLRYLGDLVDYSTLDLTISKLKDFKYNPINRDKFSERLKQSFSKGWYGFIDFLLLLIKMWPFWIIVLALFIIWKKYNKKKGKNNYQ